MFWLKFFFDLKFFDCLTTINTIWVREKLKINWFFKPKKTTAYMYTCTFNNIVIKNYFQQLTFCKNNPALDPIYLYSELWHVFLLIWKYIL